MPNKAFDISKINDYLYISAWPTDLDTGKIQDLGIRLILSMHWSKPDRSLAEPPLHLLWLPVLDSPIPPIPMSALERGVAAALPVIERGDAVLSHCRAGRHRSVVMASAVLIAKGCTAQQAMQLIKQKRAAAAPYTWYIKSRILKFERCWQERQK